jgi:hypothetical protein
MTKRLRSATLVAILLAVMTAHVQAMCTSCEEYCAWLTEMGAPCWLLRLNGCACPSNNAFPNGTLLPPPPPQWGDNTLIL